jgi:hypothetical protein
MQKLCRIILIFLISLVTVMQVDAQKRKSTSKKTPKKTVAKKSSSKKKTVAKKTTTAKKSSSKQSTAAKTATATAKEEEKKESTSKDTSKPDVVVLYSAFKPTLRNAAKINFTAATPVTDTIKSPLKYVVPAQNLFFSYQPVPIKPLALFVDSGYTWVNNGYVKAGFGGYTTPYVETGWSFGDGKKNLTSVYAMHTSSKGKLDFQQFSKTQVNLLGTYATKNNHEWTGKFNVSNSTQYLYGYQPNTLVFMKDTLKQQFNSVSLDAAYKNREPNAYGITYQPSLGVNYFADNKQGNEFTIKAKVPVTKQFSTKLALKVDLTADITAYKNNLVNVNNNLFYLNTVVEYKTSNFKLTAGIQPSWDNGETKLLPQITAEAKINGEKFIAEAGWISYFQKNTYNSLATTNPWLQQPTNLFNTKTTEQFAGFKGSAGNHLTYNARVGFITMKNMPLFVNDIADGKTFFIFTDSNLQAVKIHGELGFHIQEKFAFVAGVNIYQFTKSDFDKPYGLLPFEITGSLKWKLLKDLHLKSDIFIWDGANYRTKTSTTEKLSAAIDLNAGVEYSLMPKLNLWLQFNNLLNSKYQRWNQYEVLGLNVIGGVVYSFR